jgi:hypothetical protein
MSFAPPSPSSPPPTPAGGGPLGPPRSTPIPGFESPIADAAPPQAPTAFINSSTAATPFGFPGLNDQSPPPPVTKSGRSVGALAVAIVLLAGVGVGVYTFVRARDTSDKADQAIDDAQQTVDSLLQDAQDQIDSISVPGIPAIPGVPDASVPAPPPQVLSFAEGGAPTVIAAFEGAISGEPTRFVQVLLYPDYAFASAQDANIPTHVDEYPWRDGVVGASSPVQLFGDDDLEATLWNASDVDWTFIARAVAEAPGLTTVEQGAVSHIIVDRSVFTPDFAVVVRVYVTGPRGSAYVEYTPAGQMIDVVQ